MKLKDIVPYCLEYAQKPGNRFFEIKYYWVINGLTYTIDSLQTYSPDPLESYHYNLTDNGVGNYVKLSRYNFVNHNDIQKKYNPDNNYLTLNLDNEITIFNKFILVHKTESAYTNDESRLFVEKNHYSVIHDYNQYARHYSVGLLHPVTRLPMFDLRTTVFKDLIVPPVPPKPAEFTLDEKIDDLINELIQDNRVKAIKRLKRMLNERL